MSNGDFRTFSAGKKTKIIYCAPGYPIDGSPHGFMAAYWLKSRGYDVRIFCEGGHGSVEYELFIGRISVTSLHSGLGFQLELARELVKQRLRHEKDTIYYLHGHVVTPAAWLALIGVPRGRVIYHTQDFLEPGRHPHWELFERRFARRAGWVISNEINRARALMSVYGLKQMPTVVTTALPKNWPRPRRDATLRQSILNYVGKQDDDDCRLIMHEGGFAGVRCGRQLVDAFRLLPEHFILVFTGMNPASPAVKCLNKLAGGMGLGKRIVIPPRMEFADLMRHTACCDAGILLYPNDGIGNFYQCPGRLTHYLGCGLPIITSNFPGLELLTIKHSLGMVCDPLSPAAIAQAIQSVAGRTKSELAANSERLKQLACDELAYETCAGQLDKIIKQAIGKESW